MKQYTRSYDYRKKQKELDELKDKIIKVLRAKIVGKQSFAEISRAMELPDRTVAFKIYSANKDVPELVKMAKSG